MKCLSLSVFRCRFLFFQSKFFEHTSSLIHLYTFTLILYYLIFAEKKSLNGLLLMKNDDKMFLIFYLLQQFFMKSEPLLFGQSVIAEWFLLSLVHGCERVINMCACISYYAKHVQVGVGTSLVGRWICMQSCCEGYACHRPQLHQTNLTARLDWKCTAYAAHGRHSTAIHYNSRNVNDFLSRNLIRKNRITWIEKKNWGCQIQLNTFYLINNSKWIYFHFNGIHTELEYSLIHVSPVEIVSDLRLVVQNH